MTKKDYKSIADTIWGMSKLLKLDAGDKQMVVNYFSRRLSIDNHRFDADKFTEACQ